MDLLSISSIFLNSQIFLDSPEIENTGVHCHSFGISNLSCILESHIMMFFSISFILWNFVWLYDLVKAFKRPMHTTDKFMSFYRTITYIITAIIVFLAFLFIRNTGLYSMGATYTCNLEVSIGSMLSATIEITYIVTAFYVFLKYGRQSVINRFRKTGTKLSFFFKIQKWYLSIFTCLWATTALVFSGKSDLRQLYAIIQSLKPVLLIFPWIVQLIAMVCSRKEKTAKKKEKFNIDSIENENMLSAEESPMRKANINESLREEIVEYLLKGINKSITMFIGLGSARDVGDFDYSSESCFSKLWSKIFGCCEPEKPEETSKISPVKNKSIIFGTNINSKVKLTSKAAILRESNRELVLVLPSAQADSVEKSADFILEEENDQAIEGIRFAALGPKIFENLRELHNIDTNEIVNLFSVENLHKKLLKIKLQSGKGGAFFVLPMKGNYLIKSINEEEYDVMTDILPEYYQHFLLNPSSCINPIYGCYAITFSDSQDIKPLYFILMKNVLDVDIDNMPQNTELWCFDIKGSSAGRQELEDPKIILEANCDSELQKKTLKDDDFFGSYENVKIPPIQGNKIIEQLRSDSKFFRQYKLIDYSLLMFIINIPYKQIGINNKPAPQENLIDKNESSKNELTGGIFRTSRETRDQNPENSEPFRLSDEALKNKESAMNNENQIMLFEEKSKDRISTIYRIQDPIDFHKLEVLSTIIVDQKPEDDKKQKIIMEIHEESFHHVPQQTVLNIIPTTSISNTDKYSASKPVEELKTDSPKKSIKDYENVNSVNNQNAISSESNKSLIYSPYDNVVFLLLFKTLSKQDLYSHEIVEQLVFDPKKGGFYKRQFKFGIIDYLTVFFIFNIKN